MKKIRTALTIAGCAAVAMMFQPAAQAETDAENRHAQVENRPVRQRGVLGVNTGRPAGEDDAPRVERGNLGQRRVKGQDGREHLGLANAPRNDLCVLRPEIKDDNLLHIGGKNGEVALSKTDCQKKLSPNLSRH